MDASDPDPPLPLLLYDGACGLCARSVQFVLAREREPRLRFAALQSELGGAVLARHGLEADLSTLVLVDEAGRAHVRSDAALRIAAGLRRPWSWARVLRVVPRFLRDGAYRLVARHRLALFGDASSCRLPRPGEAERFLA